MTERAFALPEAPAQTERARFGAVELDTAAIDGAGLRRLVAALAVPEGDACARAASLACAARRFADPADPLRRLAEEWLPPTTGFARAMIAETLPLVFAPITADALSGAVAAAGPLVRRLAIVAAGNVPGVAVAKTALALAAGVPVIVKAASGEPLLSVLFARAIAEEDARLGSSHAALWWDGGRADLAAALGESVDGLVAYGSDAAVASLRRIAPTTFVGYGHRLSVAAVRLDPPAIPALAAAAARDVALHDQQGCLSPRAIFAIGPRTAAERFTDALADALADLALRVPRGRTSDGEHFAIRRLRDEAEWRAIRGEPVLLRHDHAGTAWTVILDPDPALRAGPLGRTILVHPLASAGELEALLAGGASRIESIGVAPGADGELAGIATRLRIPRTAPLGAMQAPRLDWRQGGLDPLAGIVSAAQGSRR